MSNKPGRNDPCLCGSGKKYKRCCLSIDEAAARERAQQALLDDQADDPEFDEDDDSEVDLIDLETDTDVVSIEVFNRAISLIHDDSEDMQRIHRVCGALEAAAASGFAQSAGEGGAAKPSVAVFRRADISPPPAASDMSALLKEHRRQGGTCALCGETVTRRSTLKHLVACGPAHDVARGPDERLVEVRATAPGLPAYWLDIEVKADAKLDALDSFLRDIWLECCGHLSAFRIGATSYFSRGYDFGFTRALGGFGRRQEPERSMNVKIGDALPSSGEPFEYEYDFGSTTSLQLKVTRERTGRPGRPPVRLLVRNTPPRWPCAICGESSTLVCAYCAQSEDNAFVCKKHRKQHACGEDEGYLPVVNSPRMGVCGYTSDT